MNIPDGIWFGILIVAETIAIPYHEAVFVYSRACDQYKYYKKSKSR